jgi:hypothetical protein
MSLKEEFTKRALNYYKMNQKDLNNEGKLLANAIVEHVKANYNGDPDYSVWVLAADCAAARFKSSYAWCLANSKGELCKPYLLHKHSVALKDFGEFKRWLHKWTNTAVEQMEDCFRLFDGYVPENCEGFAHAKRIRVADNFMEQVKAQCK